LESAQLACNPFGFLYYSYVIMQIPRGYSRIPGLSQAVDGRRMIATLGRSFLSAHEFFWANIGRILIGGSVAVGYVALLKLSSCWLPKILRPPAGWALFFRSRRSRNRRGWPLRLLIDTLGWRSSLFVSGLITFGCTLLTWWIVRDDPAAKGYRSFAPQTLRKAACVPISECLPGLGTILQYRNTWLLFFSPGGVVGQF